MTNRTPNGLKGRNLSKMEWDIGDMSPDKVHIKQLIEDIEGDCLGFGEKRVIPPNRKLVQHQITVFRGRKCNNKKPLCTREKFNVTKD